MLRPLYIHGIAAAEREAREMSRLHSCDVAILEYFGGGAFSTFTRCFLDDAGWAWALRYARQVVRFGGAA